MKRSYRGKWLTLLQECMSAGRSADDCAMDACPAAAPQALAYADLPFGVRSILICQTLAMDFRAKVSSRP